MATPRLGHQHCELVFGWLGKTIPRRCPGYDEWPCEAEITKPEEAGLGEFGGDDVFLQVPSIDGEFCFCHHQGIHLTYNEPGAIVSHFLERWTMAGWDPLERDCESSH